MYVPDHKESGCAFITFIIAFILTILIFPPAWVLGVVIVSVYAVLRLFTKPLDMIYQSFKSDIVNRTNKFINNMLVG